MSTCKKCGATVAWKEKPGGGFFPPQNPDGTRHDCENKAQVAQPGGIVGRLESYGTGSAAFTLKGNVRKIYALPTPVQKAWADASFLLPASNHPDVWLEFSVDSKNFIQQGWHQVQRPEWAASLSDPTGGEITSVTGHGEQPPEGTCTSPTGDIPPVLPKSDEDLIRERVAAMMPSDRVGCRISLAGMVNSVIEIKKTHGKPIDIEEIKREAVALFIWCDGLTTQNLKKGGV